MLKAGSCTQHAREADKAVAVRFVPWFQERKSIGGCWGIVDKKGLMYFFRDWTKLQVVFFTTICFAIHTTLLSYPNILPILPCNFQQSFTALHLEGLRELLFAACFGLAKTNISKTKLSTCVLSICLQKKAPSLYLKTLIFCGLTTEIHLRLSSET